MTNQTINKLIDDYKLHKYDIAVKNRSWDNMYIHTPRTKYYNSDGLPYCYIWKKLVKENRAILNQCKSFEDLITALRLLHDKNDIKGIGELIIYDTATCIGCPQKLYPQSVYLHAGAKDGAKQIGIEGKEVKKNTFIEKYPAFERLSELEIEDFLCIYKFDLIGNPNKGEKARKFVRNNARKCSCCQ